MAYWIFKLEEHNANNSGIRGQVASNSLVVKQGSPLKSAASWVALATAGDTIVGISTDDKTFASDNFTVAKSNVHFNPEPNMNNTYELDIIGGTVTIADEGVSYFDIVVDGSGGYAVDGTSESASSGQLLLVKYVSATKGIFMVVNL